MSRRIEQEILGTERRVVSIPLLRVAKHGIGLVDRPRTLGGFRAWVRVGMIAPHQGVIGGTDHDILGCRGHAQD